ncbi:MULTISPECIES: helix-turn-helix domain-containing protein [unclassified Serratia (in: enterobacteria)]|uniref:helix-turn-helix domain-containing protein n=1 Tax=unclassified Serratia (in: enterobacteria) TaxID=2647522 RepID=UPI0030760E25
MYQKKIVLQCACHFTYLGLSSLINNTFSFHNVNVIGSSHFPEKFASDVSDFISGDIAIIALSHSDYNPASLINLVYGRLAKVPLSSRILLIGDPTYLPRLQYYLGSLKNTWAFMDISMPTRQLQQQLHHAVSMHADMYQRSKPTGNTLTRRELSMLYRLLNGQSVMQIAKEFGISEKTVSCHKRSALVKLKMRSLHPLLLDNNHKETLFHKLSPLMPDYPARKRRFILPILLEGIDQKTSRLSKRRRLVREFV